MVAEIISGTSAPRSSNSSSMPAIAALAFSVSKIVSSSSRSAPPSISPRTCSRYASRTCAKVVARNAGLLTSGEIDSVRLVGPIAPATKRGRSGVRVGPLVGGRAGQACAFDVQLVGERLEAEVGLRDRGAAERVGLDDVRAGLEVGVMDARDHVGTREDQQVDVVLSRSRRMIAEPLAAKSCLGQLVRWIIVPMAPSSIRMRPASARSKSGAAVDMASGPRAVRTRCGLRCVASDGPAWCRSR